MHYYYLQNIKNAVFLLIPVLAREEVIVQLPVATDNLQIHINTIIPISLTLSLSGDLEPHRDCLISQWKQLPIHFLQFSPSQLSPFFSFPTMPCLSIYLVLLLKTSKRSAIFYYSNLFFGVLLFSGDLGFYDSSFMCVLLGFHVKCLLLMCFLIWFLLKDLTFYPFICVYLVLGSIFWNGYFLNPVFKMRIWSQERVIQYCYWLMRTCIMFEDKRV